MGLNLDDFYLLKILLIKFIAPNVSIWAYIMCVCINGACIHCCLLVIATITGNFNTDITYFTLLLFWCTVLITRIYTVGCGYMYNITQCDRFTIVNSFSIVVLRFAFFQKLSYTLLWLASMPYPLTLAFLKLVWIGLKFAKHKFCPFSILQI